ncbi:hypothetical protein [Pectobacterium versatile]|uniref:hypothetical protein n=1 Tax=Pectobacterium versatile TaxID=2488639 RepID=UPI001CCDE2F8|nr:hypothetical protein [Pectobacterium versatile]
MRRKLAPRRERVASDPQSPIPTKAPRQRHNFRRKPGVTGRAAIEPPRVGRVLLSSMNMTVLPRTKSSLSQHK